ncbi:MAG: hypothetical protein AAFO29_00985, partial [Actinomycetota bacterium]
MTACTEAGCTGTIAADGYCDTCGVKPAPTPSAPPPPSVPSASSAASGPAAVGGSTGAPSAPPPPPATPASAGPTGPPPPSQPPPAPAPVAAASAGASSGPARPAGSACGRDGCVGTIAPDGYCDICGLAAASRGGPMPVAATSDAAGLDSSGNQVIAVPQAPDTSARIPGAGTATARSRSTSTSRRTASARTGIGAGLVSVAPTTVGDPGAAVMDEEDIREALGVVPEDERFC